MKCKNCNSKFDIKIIAKGKKGTEPFIEFCPMCGQELENECEFSTMGFTER